MIHMPESKETRQMRSRRAEIVDECRVITAKGATISPADEKKFNGLMDEADRLAKAIDRANGVDVLDHELSQPLNNRRAGLENGLPADRDGATWIDEKTGSAIRVLSKGEKLADLYPDYGPGPRASLGDAVKAMISPSGVSPDVRAAVRESSSTAGGYLVPDSLSAEVIDNLRAQSVCFRAGARVVPMPEATMNIAKLTRDAQATFRVENQALTEDSPEFGRLRLSARSLAVIVKASREIVQDAPNFSELMTNMLGKSFALSADYSFLYGAGVSDPMGVVNWDGVGSVSMGADGAQITSYDPLLDAVYEAHVDNAGDFSAAVFHPRTERTLSKIKDGAGLPMPRPPAIESLPLYSTTQIPIDETQGASTDCSSIICGDFSQMIVGVRTQLQIEVLRERFADTLQYGILAYLRTDMVLAHPEAFVRIVGVKP